MTRLPELSITELARYLAVVEQEREIGFDFTVREIVALRRLLHRGTFTRETSVDKQWITEAMELTNVAPFAERSIRELLGGEKHRVFLAMALAQDPRVLLLDAPTSYLDINHQLQIMEIICQQAAAALTVLMVIHDLNLAAQYADRVAILHQGQLLAIGGPADALTQANIKQAFQTDVVVGKNAVTNSIYINTVPTQLTRPTSLGKLHIICGGGSGVTVLHALADRFSLSVGVVSPLDSDFQAAQHLSAKLVVEAPFAPISSRAYKENLAAMQSSDGVVICETPFGPGNMLNLSTTLELESKASIYVLHPETIERRDHTGGQATKLFRRLLGSGAVPVEDVRELKRHLVSRYHSDNRSLLQPSRERALKLPGR